MLVLFNRVQQDRARKHMSLRMQRYYAHFERIDRKMFRLDTRIYLDSRDDPKPHGKCVAAVVAKNPSSASARSIGVWDRLDLKHDRLLPSVRNRFLAAYRKANKRAPYGAYVRVLEPVLFV